MKAERSVAGLRCSEVIARLDGFVDGTLSEAERAQVVAHVGGCSLCEDFGGRYAKVIAGIRRTYGAPEGDDADAKARILAKVTGRRRG